VIRAPGRRREELLRRRVAKALELKAMHASVLFCREHVVLNKAIPATDSSIFAVCANMMVPQVRSNMRLCALCSGGT
jgi:hypothetical protein